MIEPIRAGIRVGKTSIGTMTLDLDMGQQKPVRLHLTADAAADLFQSIGEYLEAFHSEMRKQGEITKWARELGVSG